MSNSQEDQVQQQSEKAMSSAEQLELVRWLIDRYDSQRSAVANRAAIVISGNALLLGGVTLMLGNILSGSSKYANFQKSFLYVLAAANIVVVALSILFAISAVAFVWKTSRKAVKFDQTKPILFFHPRETLSTYRNTDSFSDAFRAASIEQMLEYGLRELLFVTNTHFHRYDDFRRSLQALFIAVVLFCLLTFVVLVFSP